MSERRKWFDDDDGLGVFVPGLMATGILASIGMFVWDGVRRVIPDFGRRQRAATSALHTSGRVSDLTAVTLGQPPLATPTPRARRSRGIALLLALASFVAAGTLASLTLAAYLANEGRLAGRGWTLSAGFAVVAGFVTLGLVWLISALADERVPKWIAALNAHWPIGALPDPRDTEL